MERREQLAFICTGRTIPDGGDVSSARSVGKGGALEKPAPTNARQVYERAKHPEDWAEDQSVPTSARQLYEQSKHGGARTGSGRPKIDLTAKARPVGFSLPPHLIVWIEEAAAEAGMSKSAFVAHVLERSRRAALRRNR
jgi:hypothetical protein